MTNKKTPAATRKRKAQPPTPRKPAPRTAPTTAATPKARAPKPRTPGRPGANTVDQRAALLDAALRCYVRDGIAATSLRAIAREAGVTPALVNYYFGDGLRVQAAVIEERLLPNLDGLRGALAESGDDPAAMVSGFVAAIGALVARHPWFPSLWVREVLSEGGALRELLIERVGPMLPQLLAKRFAAAQARGVLNPDLDPRLLVVSLIGLTLFPIAGKPIWQRLFGTGELGFDVLQRHVLTLLWRGLEVDRGE